MRSCSADMRLENDNSSYETLRDVNIPSESCDCVNTAAERDRLRRNNTNSINQNTTDDGASATNSAAVDTQNRLPAVEFRDNDQIVEFQDDDGSKVVCFIHPPSTDGRNDDLDAHHEVEISDDGSRSPKSPTYSKTGRSKKKSNREAIYQWLDLCPDVYSEDPPPFQGLELSLETEHESETMPEERLEKPFFLKLRQRIQRSLAARKS